MVGEWELTRLITKTVTPTSISSQQNDYRPSGINDADTLRVSGDTSHRLITGLIKRNANNMSSIDDGAEITLRNVGANTLLLCDELSTPALSSTANNRFKFNRDVPLFPFRSIDLVYDGTLLRWIPKIDLGMVTPPPRLGYAYVNHGFRNSSDALVQLTAASGGAISETNQSNVVDRPGLLEWSTGTSATGSGSMTTGNPNALMLGNFWYWKYDMIFRILTLSSAGMAYTLRIGFIDSITAESTDGVFLRYTHAANSGKFQAVSRSNNVEAGSASDTGITAEVNNYHRFTVNVFPAGNLADFYIDGTLIGSQSTNIPTAATRGVGAGFMFIKTAGITNASFLVMDSFELAGYAPRIL
jgi:SO2946-like, C-terminal domain